MKNRGKTVPNRRPSPSKTGLRPGYILLELVIAIAMFAVAVLGLARSLNTSLEVANILNKDNMVRIGMRSFLEEVRRKPVTEMATSAVDERLGCTFTSTVEPVTLQNSSGRNLADLYQLTIKALYTAGNEQRDESVMVYVYRPQQQQSR